MEAAYWKHADALFANFRLQNRLTQEVIRYLLFTEGQDSKTCARLILLVFGKMAAGKFQSHGLPSFLKREKLHLRGRVREHLRIADQENLKKSSIFTEKQIGEEMKSRRSRMETQEKQPKRNESQIQTKEAAPEAKKLRKLTRSERRANKAKILKFKGFLDRLLKAGIPQNYFEHFVWMILFSKSWADVLRFRDALAEAFLSNGKGKGGPQKKDSGNGRSRRDGKSIRN